MSYFKRLVSRLAAGVLGTLLGLEVALRADRWITANDLWPSIIPAIALGWPFLCVGLGIVWLIGDTIDGT